MTVTHSRVICRKYPAHPVRKESRQRSVDNRVWYLLIFWGGSKLEVFFYMYGRWQMKLRKKSKQFLVWRPKQIVVKVLGKGGGDGMLMSPVLEFIITLVHCCWWIFSKKLFNRTTVNRFVRHRFSIEILSTELKSLMQLEPAWNCMICGTTDGILFPACW